VAETLALALLMARVLMPTEWVQLQVLERAELKRAEQERAELERA
jgi:hypothetical protein